MKKFITKFFRLKDQNRSDNVIFVLLLFFWTVSIILFVINVINKIILGGNYRGNSLLYSFLTILFILAITQIYRKGHRILINYCFLLLLLACCLYIIVVSGLVNPYALLLVVFYIVISSIMLSGKKLFASIFSIVAGFLVVGYLELHNIIHPDLSWKIEPTKMADILGIIILLTIIIFISWLFNHEINRYISELETSEKMLKNERDLLEIRVKERTAQLQEEQAQRLAQLSKFAEFGRLAQGLIHDLTNPLTALSLNLDQLKKEKDSSKIRRYFAEATVASDNMKKLIESTTAYSQHRIEKESFSIVKELKNANLVCSYKARQAGVNLVFQKKNDTTLFGNRGRFSQLICNLVLNAIEAFESKNNNGKKEIAINFHKDVNKIVMKIKDNADGIPETILKNIFEPFFSTKKKKGNSGIGLATCRDIVENDFLGKIEVKSKLGVGSEFMIFIPQRNNARR